jgi:hypothetical protein
MQRYSNNRLICLWNSATWWVERETPFRVLVAVKLLSPLQRNCKWKELLIDLTNKAFSRMLVHWVLFHVIYFLNLIEFLISLPFITFFCNSLISLFPLFLYFISRFRSLSFLFTWFLFYVISYFLFPFLCTYLASLFPCYHSFLTFIS